MRKIFRKILFAVFCFSLFNINVYATDYYTDDIFNNMNYNFFELYPGDKIYMRGFSLNYIIVQGTKVSPKEPYEILSYEEFTGMVVPEGKIAKIYGYLAENTPSHAITSFCVFYVIEDDVQKKVVYYNTYDAVNDNPTTYYEGQTDILLTDIKRDGYKFLGWYSSPTFEEDTRVTMIDKDASEVLELYAKWEKIETDNMTNDFINPNTSSLLYVGVGIIIILILGTLVVIVYKKNK